MHCDQCGTVIHEGALFCKKCGARQGPMAAPSVDMSAALPVPAVSRAEAAVARAEAPRPAKSGTRPVVWAVVASVVVSLGGLAGYLGWRNKVDAEEAAQKLALFAAESGRHVAESERRAADEVTAIAGVRQAAAEASERAEIAAAKAALDKVISEEEALAKASAGAQK